MDVHEVWWLLIIDPINSRNLGRATHQGLLSLSSGTTRCQYSYHRAQHPNPSLTYAPCMFRACTISEPRVTSATTTRSLGSLHTASSAQFSVALRPALGLPAELWAPHHVYPLPTCPWSAPPVPNPPPFSYLVSTSTSIVSSWVVSTTASSLSLIATCIAHGPKPYSMLPFGVGM